jgi:hypothetical protein
VRQNESDSVALSELRAFSKHHQGLRAFALAPGYLLSAPPALNTFPDTARNAAASAKNPIGQAYDCEL